MLIKNIIKDIFGSACKHINNKKLDEPEFELCKNTIQITLTYLGRKRKQA